MGYRYLQSAPAASPYVCPPGEGPVNPLHAPCFYGALIYTVALGVSMAARRRARAPGR